LEECEEYLQKEYCGELSEEKLRIEAEKIVYKKAVKDTFEMLRFFKII
jgi:oligoribonuclease NrnB/cAMP/cGMP phosphodiesterase (DHH superfamily)